MKRVLFLLLLAGTFFIGSEAEARSYSQMSRYELWYARNAIFVQEGYCFTAWKAINTFGRLSRYEANELDRIKFWERRKGCTGGYVAPAPAPSYGGGGGYAQVVGIRPNGCLAVRTGPGTSSPLISSLYRGDSRIEVLRCIGS